MTTFDDFKFDSLAEVDSKNFGFVFDFQRFDEEYDTDLDIDSEIGSEYEEESEPEAEWRLKGTKAIYGTDSETIVTVEGVISKDGLSIEGTTVTVDASSLSQNSTVSISSGYNLRLGENVTKFSQGEVTWSASSNGMSGRVQATESGYKIENNQIKYVQQGSSSSFVVSGVTTEEGLSVEGNVITVSNASLSDATLVSVSNGYELKLGDDVQKPTDEGKNTWSFVSGTLTYTSPDRINGYRLEDNVITYIRSTQRSSAVINGLKDELNGTYTGVNSINGITLSGSTFIISESALKENDVWLSGDEGYKLALADDVDPPEKPTSEGWVLNNETHVASYGSNAANGGYELSDEDSKIKYTQGKVENVVVEIKGVQSTDGLEIDTSDKSIGVYESALIEGEDISVVSGDYTLELMYKEDLEPQPIVGWKIKDGNAKYYEYGAFTDGYREASNNKKVIQYVPEAITDIRVELEGIESDELTFGSTEDSEAGLTENDPDSGIIEFEVENFSGSGISVVSNNYKYQFHILAGNYNEGTRFDGSGEIDSIENSGDNMIIAGGAGADRITNSGGIVLIEGGAGNDRIETKGEIVTIAGGAGNDNITLSGNGGNTLFYGKNDGKDNVEKFNTNDRIMFDDNIPISAISANVQSGNVVFKIGTSGTITLKDAAKDEEDKDPVEIVIVDQEGKETEISRSTYTHDGVVSDISSERKIVLATDFSGEYIADSSIKKTGAVTIVDGSQVQRGNVSLNAGTEGQSLIGSAGKDTFISGAQAFSMKGGKGNDVFVFNGGKGTIADYSQKGTYGKDKVVVAAGLSFTGYNMEGSNVVLNYGESNSLTLEGAEDKEISFGTTASDPVYSYNTNGIFDSKGKGVTLASENNHFTATKNYSKIETIDASMVRDSVEIMGNKKANYIISGMGIEGAGKSILNGGKGTDTLVGGSDDDIFVYDNKSGNKLIRNYEYDDESDGGDVISLGGGAELSEVKNKGKDLELKVGSNKITIEGGANNPFKFNDGEEKSYNNGLLISSDGKSASVTGSFDFKTNNYTIDLETNENNIYAKINNVDASLVKQNLTLIGSEDSDNSLTGSKGNDIIKSGTGNDYLKGGKGNDELWGGDGNDTFVFWAGDGTDTIKDFESSIDNLKICDKRGREIEKNAFTSSVFNNNTNVLTLSIKGGGKIILEGMNQGDSVSVNGQAHSINGKKLS